jgi:hypothetical protein
VKTVHHIAIASVNSLHTMCPVPKQPGFGGSSGRRMSLWAVMSGVVPGESGGD